jgi:ABC-type nickel/cobalt efflux system permease component RcnA
VYLQSAPADRRALTAWESGQPNLPGLSGPLSNLAASPATALTNLVREENLSPAFLLAAFLLSLALGALHALTPGHGKTLVAAYLVGSQGRTRDAVFLGSVVTATHTGSVLVLGLITLVASRYILPAVFVPALELASGLLVVAFGLRLLVQRGRALYAWWAAAHVRQLRARHGTASAAELGTAHSHDAHDHSHHHPHSHSHAPSPVDPARPEHHPARRAPELPGSRVTWRSLLALGVSGGLVPCPDAIAILLVAVAVDRIPLGMLLIVAFSLGLAAVLIALGVAMVHGMRVIARNDMLNRFGVYTPTLSALAVLALGLGLTATAASSAFFSPAGQSAVSQALPTFPRPAHAAQSFDPKAARLLYLAQADARQIQLFSRPLFGGDALQLTRDASGVGEFSLSPDKKTILYTTPRTPAGSTLWLINADGTGQRQLLDCPQSYCSKTVWSPDGQQLMYERTDLGQKAMLLLPSIWRLDLKSGDTEPVFQDRQLASLAPRFSADGRWLSYISPSTMTLQVYALGGGKNLSLPYRSGVPEMWSPTSDTFLIWSQTAAGPLHLYLYDMATSRGTDLSGAPEENDYGAAWSPDGQWIAMTRAGLTSTAGGPALLEKVWLVRPDGTQAHQLLGEAGVAYEDLQWSPDGRYLLYTHDADAQTTQIRLADVQTGQETPLVSAARQPLLLP